MRYRSWIDQQGGKPRTLAVDHDHETGCLRGLLCEGCNRGIGLLRDDPDLLRRAADYIERFRGTGVQLDLRRFLNSPVQQGEGAEV